jgi:hypothetical protein
MAQRTAGASGRDGPVIVKASAALGESTANSSPSVGNQNAGNQAIQRASRNGENPSKAEAQSPKPTKSNPPRSSAAKMSGFHAE